MKYISGIALKATFCLVTLTCVALASAELTVLDLDKDTSRQVVVDREQGQYLGHPTTCLLEDGKTMLCVYPTGHGRGQILYRRSTDGGLTWSERLPTPESWTTSKEVPTLHRVVDASGTKRIIMWSGLFPARLAVTEDDGANWSELKPVGDWGGIVTMGTVIDLNTGPGHYMGFFHDDGRFFAADSKRENPKLMTLYTTRSEDGGLSWSFPKVVYKSKQIHLCEPGALRSPDGKQIAVLLRENARAKNSHIIFSNDEGKTWTEPRELPDSLNGDRHTAKYSPDGRLFISFRSRSPKGKKAKFEGDWVAWVGTYEDLVKGRLGQYHVRLKDNTHGWDCAYPGVEVLPDGTFVTTTYGHWTKGEAPFVLSVRLKLDELDELARARKQALAETPNILFVLVDDLGWADLGYQGSEIYETPNIDRLASEGMAFSDFYAGGPVCSPTRASILTGKYTARTGITTYLLSPSRDAAHLASHLPLEEFTIAEAFRKNGFATGYFGKWHLGYKNEHWAARQGFDVAKGGMDLPWAWTLCYPGVEAPTAKTWRKGHTRFFSPHHLTHLKNGPEGEYLTDRLTDETIAFIEQERDKRFFAFLSFHTVHTPLEAKPEVVEHYRKKIAAFGLDRKKEKDRREKAHQNLPEYAAMVHHMDENVGRLLNRLDALDLAKNTIVIFTSDNGGKGSVTSNLPLRGMKHNLYEGGIRVPLIVRWPGKIEAGSKNATPVITNDFYPTLLDLADCPPEPEQHLDGISFKPLLAGETESIYRDALYWHYPHSRQEAAIREGRYKLLHRFEKDAVELYDLDTDIGERKDLIQSEPERATRMLAKLKSWQQSVGAEFQKSKEPSQQSETKAKERPTTGNGQQATTAKRPNVLFIAVDDWNDWVGCLGHAQAKTPNVDRLAARGMLFTNAHCTVSVCNPSRVAIMTGLRPETTGVFENNHRMRKKVPDLVTLPQHFRQNGYRAEGGGKIYHDVPPYCDDPPSWDDYFWWNEHGPKGGKVADGGFRSPYSIPPDPEPNGRPTRKITSLTKRNFDWGPVDQPESDWPDHQVAEWASEFLTKPQEKPFFLAVGIFRPHVPWFNPQKYFDLYPEDKIELPPVVENDVDDLGPWARKRAMDPNSKHDRLVEAGEWKSAVQAYLASISHADAKVGRVLDALDQGPHKDNTIIVLWSDHGYHLGEKGHWHKRTLWERATRVPLIVVAPGVTESGTKCSQPVNLIDLYPTLIELCGVKSRDELAGHSLLTLLKNPSAKSDRPSITTYLPGNHAVRTNHWRYIRYATGDEELYDHRNDPNEWNNLADNPDMKSVIAKHQKWLP